MELRDDFPDWLAALIAPVPVGDFLSNYWLKQFLFCRGAADRFAPLLSWGELDRILEHHWRETFRFRLARQGRDLDPSVYSDSGPFTPRIRAKDITDQLRRGATLSFDAIDELHEPLTRLAERFESFFRGGTKINIYAGWRAMHGLDLHRDNQEIFILQLDGRKRWLLYGFSIEGVDASRLASTSEPPAGASLDQILEPGDLLYIPRGCYHVAVPLDEPTLHLTLGVKNPRGMDLLTWLVDRLRTTEIAGRDLPILADAAERLRYAEELRHALVAGLESDLVEQYLAETGSNFKPRPRFNLPWSATPELLPNGRNFCLQMNGRARMSANGSGAFELLFGGRTLRFPSGMRWVVEQLDDTQPRLMGHIVDTLAGRMDEGTIRMLVGMLVKENLVAITA
jgi:ribosomal protein L16 Arg81 hydroxylase